MEMHEPYTFLNGLTVADMEDLLEDIQVRPAVCPRHPHHLQAPALPSHHLCPLQVYMELEQGKNADFWRDMTIITEDEISKLRKLEASGKGPGNVGQASSVTPLGLAGVRQVAPQKTPILCKSLLPSGVATASPGLSASHQERLVLSEGLFCWWGSLTQ